MVEVMFRTLQILVFALIIAPSEAFACFALPKYVRSSPTEYVHRSEQIVLARAREELIEQKVRDRRSRGLKTIIKSGIFFDIIEVLKGDPSLPWPDDLYFPAHQETKWSWLFDGEQTDFNAHQYPWFWWPHGGRTNGKFGLCGPPHSFEDGAVYLLFPQTYLHAKSGERIDDTDKDRWLAFVRSQLTESK